MRRRWLVSALVVGALAVVAAGCGGDDNGGGGVEGSSDITGNLSVMAIWGGDEQDSFQAVIDGFTAKYPNVTVKYTSGGDNLAPLLSTAIKGGNPPDLAAVGQPGLMQGFVEQGAIQPIDQLRQQIVDNFGQAVADVGAVDGKQYAVMFKGANKSTIWYNVADFDEAGVKAPTTWDELKDRRLDVEVGRDHPVLGRCGRRLADHRPVREHLPPHRGPGDVRQAREARDPLDRPVREGRDDEDEGRRRDLGRHGRRHGRRAADGHARRRWRTCSPTTRRARWS